jgi:hypothetical protein
MPKRYLFEKTLKIKTHFYIYTIIKKKGTTQKITTTAIILIIAINAILII